MLCNNHYIKKLIGFKGIILEQLETSSDSMSFSFSLEIKTHNYPKCHQQTSKVHDYRIQMIKDISISGKKTYLYYKKRRYVCNHCNKKFYEKNDFLPRYQRMTSRLIKYIITRMKNVYSVSDIAKENNISPSTALRLFRFINYSLTKLPEAISIDEFKGNAGGKKYQCILTDPQNKKVLDILHGREQHILSDYFRKFNDRDKVKYFIMDMWQPYKDIIETYFKNATIIIDKFHFIRQVTWAFERIRKDEQKKFAKERRRYFKRSRSLLLKRMKYLTPEEIDQVNVMLATSEKLQKAYMLKEKFYNFVDSSDLESAKKNLKAWYMFVMSCELEEFDKCSRTIFNWQKYILNSFTCTYTNGYTEGVNNKIKVLKRNAYGVRNFWRFKNRIMHVMN